MGGHAVLRLAVPFQISDAVSSFAYGIGVVLAGWPRS